MKEDTTDFGYKTVNIHDKRKLVTQVFDSVASRYDLMNDLMSLGIHRLWKRHAISMCQLRKGQKVLDVAGGTGDLTRLISPIVTMSGQVVLSDININMLIQAKNRLLDEGLVDNISIVQGNAEHLPFESNLFDRVIIGFGLRNVTYKDLALKSFFRSLKPGGRLVILEFSHPTNACFSQLYDTYSFHVLPKLGKWIANDADSYQYLAESIRQFPDQETLKAMMAACGFERCHYQNLSGGIVAVHSGIKY